MYYLLIIFYLFIYLQTEFLISLKGSICYITVLL